MLLVIQQTKSDAAEKVITLVARQLCCGKGELKSDETFPEHFKQPSESKTQSKELKVLEKCASTNVNELLVVAFKI